MSIAAFQEHSFTPKELLAIAQWLDDRVSVDTSLFFAPVKNTPRRELPGKITDFSFVILSASNGRTPLEERTRRIHLLVEAYVPTARRLSGTPNAPYDHCSCSLTYFLGHQCENYAYSQAIYRFLWEEKAKTPPLEQVRPHLIRHFPRELTSIIQGYAQPEAYAAEIQTLTIPKPDPIHAFNNNPVIRWICQNDDLPSFRWLNWILLGRPSVNSNSNSHSQTYSDLDTGGISA